jgi:hypothetical protein
MRSASATSGKTTFNGAQAKLVVRLRIESSLSFFLLAALPVRSGRTGRLNDYDEFCRNRAVAVVETMRQVGITRATIARLEVGDVVAKRDPDSARRQKNVLYRARSVRRKWPDQRMRRHHMGGAKS